MRATAFAIALMLGGAAFAQTTTTTTTSPDVDVDAGVGVQPDGDLDIDADVDVDTKTTTTTNATTTHGTMSHGTMSHGTTGHSTTGTTMSHTMASNVSTGGQIVQPDNDNPERDARGIAVISAPAVAPSGWNGGASSGVGGPLVDATTGQTAGAEANYPACSRTVTDNCVQAYERGTR